LISQPSLTRAGATAIVARWKYVLSVKLDNTVPPRSERARKDYVPPNEKIIIWDLAFADMRGKSTPLQFHARIETPISGFSVRPRPGISLKWSGRRIRAICWAARHDGTLDGRPLPPVRKWHEKQWTEADEDKYIVDVNQEIQNEDFRSLIKFCCKRWNIECPVEIQKRMGDL
jgi:hypothetical protein